MGVDGDHIDVFLSNNIDGWDGRKVYVVDQYNPDGGFDEHKVMLGFNDINEAKSDYLANYGKGWENGRRIDVSAMDLKDFEKWIALSKRKTKPFREYSSVKKEDGENQLKNKLKSDRLLYKATALDAPANTSAEQPIIGGSLSSEKQAEKNGGELVMLSPKDKVESLSTPQNDLSSDNKDSKVSDTKQENLSENDRANLAELSEFAVDTDSAKRTAVDAAGFDSEALTIPLLVDGKPSRLSVATIVPAVITDRPYQTAVYYYSDDIDDKTNSGWQKWEDLSDEYNSKVSEEEKASVFGDSAELHFKTVDAAVKFDDWLRSGRIEKQQSADELRNDTAAKQLATNAVLYALDNAGISVEVVSDEAASEMLGRNEALSLIHISEPTRPY